MGMEKYILTNILISENKEKKSPSINKNTSSNTSLITMAHVRVNLLNRLFSGMTVIAKRNMGATAVCANQLSDPIQKIFLDKLNEYKEKAAALGDEGLVDKTPEMELDIQAEVDNLNKRYGGGNMEE